MFTSDENSSRRAGRARSVARSLLGCWLGLTCFGCGTADNSGQPPAAEVSPAETAAIAGHRVDQFAAFLKPILDRAEPEGDDWETEVISANVTARLKKLAGLLAHPQDLTAAALQPLVADSISVATLRPALRTAVFEDQSLTVFRAQNDSPQDQTFQTGDSALADALIELLEPLRDCQSIDVHFKVYRVEAQPDGQLTSLAYFDSRGARANGIVQQNSIWHCTWKIDNSTPLLMKLWVSDFEESMPKPDGGPVFADVTEAVLGQTASFRQQWDPLESTCRHASLSIL